MRARVARAQQAITALTVRRRGKPRLPTVAAVQQAAAAVLAQERVEGLLHVAITEQVQERPVRAYAGRPAQARRTHTLHAQAVVDTDALEAAVQRLGWRVYATNAPADDLSTTQAVLAYRQEYLIERAFGRLKGRLLSLTPLYLERDDHVTGLIRLLSIALRVLTTVEHTVRQRLAQEQRTVTGLYAGSPTVILASSSPQPPSVSEVQPTSSNPCTRACVRTRLDAVHAALPRHRFTASPAPPDGANGPHRAGGSGGWGGREGARRRRHALGS